MNAPYSRVFCKFKTHLRLVKTERSYKPEIPTVINIAKMTKSNLMQISLWSYLVATLKHYISYGIFFQRNAVKVDLNTRHQATQQIVSYKIWIFLLARDIWKFTFAFLEPKLAVVYYIPFPCIIWRPFPNGDVRPCRHAALRMLETPVPPLHHQYPSQRWKLSIYGIHNQ